MLTALHEIVLLVDDADTFEHDRPLALRQQACLALARPRSTAARGALEAAATSDPSAHVQHLAASALAAVGG